MTGSARLQRLTMTAFRGSPETFKLDFKADSKITLIYGENGTGKTTICDAFEFLARAEVTSLKDRGLGSGLEKYWPSAGKEPTDLVVELTTSAGTCRGSIVKRKSVIEPSARRPRLELLRQRQILNLIEAAPNDRYNAIKRFIDIAECERSEEALKGAITTATGERDRAVAAEQESLGALRDAYELEGNPPAANEVEWALKKVNEPTDDIDRRAEALDQLRTLFLALDGRLNQFKTAQAEADRATEAKQWAEQRLLEARAKSDTSESDKLKVIEAGRAFIEEHGAVEECPLCQSRENVADLAPRLAHRLAQLASLSHALDVWATAEAALGAAVAGEAQALGDLRRAAEAFTQASQAEVWGHEIELPAAPVPQTPDDLAKWLAINAALPELWRLTAAGWIDRSRSIRLIKSAYERYTDNRDKIGRLAALIPHLENAQIVVRTVRQQFTDSIISQIADAVGELYERVHPGEGLNRISLQLDPKQRASLGLEVKAFDLDVPPQAYFSQSHLDTLGLCVFLALARRNQPADTVLILDDVLGSVDEPHVDRIIDMIYSISAEFQHTIVTTHYRRWREKFRWGQLRPNHPIHLVELKPWSRSEGIRLGGSIPETERLRTELAKPEPDLQLVTSKAGVILEAILDHLTLKYGCAVPRRAGGNFTIGDLLPSIGKKLKGALRVELRDGIAKDDAQTGQLIPLQPILDELSRIAHARSVMGAHFNSLSFDMLDLDATAFAWQVLALADALIHPEHGWPTRDDTGEYWHNPKHSRRLFPLQKPKD